MTGLFSISLGDLITFEKPKALLCRLDARTQARLEVLMAKNNEGQLTTSERKEYSALAEQAHRISLENARTLLAERRRAGNQADVAKKQTRVKRTTLAA